MAKTLIEAQQRYIRRLREAHPGHLRRVRRSAWTELFRWAEKRGYAGLPVCKDAHDMYLLEERSDE